MRARKKRTASIRAAFLYSKKRAFESLSLTILLASVVSGSSGGATRQAKFLRTAAENKFTSREAPAYPKLGIFTCCIKNCKYLRLQEMEQSCRDSASDFIFSKESRKWVAVRVFEIFVKDNAL